VFGPQGGDLLHADTIAKLWADGRENSFDLVTGDGGLDTDDEPRSQESKNAPLIAAQFWYVSR
jgi:hypothetical protein